MKREQIVGLCVLLLLAAGTIFAVSNYPLETAKDPLEGEDAYMEFLSSVPLAVVEGETISHNQRFLVRTVGATDSYVSGVRVPEKIQVVNRSTDEVVWEDRGMVRQEALWSPEDGFLALARSARTWCSVTVFETENWTSWEFALPDGNPIPEYTFLPYSEPWGEWQDECTLNLTVGRGDEDPPKRYLCTFSTEDGTITGQSWEPVTEILPGGYDFDHDGELETVELTAVRESGRSGPGAAAYNLAVVGGEGSTLWEVGAHTAHIGWTSIFACSIDGLDYLIRYHPTMYQGWADYSFQVFSLNAAGIEQILHENSVIWDCNFRMEGHQYDVDALVGFLWDLHGYLEHSTLLMSTEDGEFQSNIPGLQIQSYPFGGALRLDSREALEETVRRMEAEWKNEQGIIE